MKDIVILNKITDFSELWDDVSIQLNKMYKKNTLVLDISSEKVAY